MRLFEFASAAEQLALWRLVSDSVWQAIEIQQKQEAAAEAKKAREAKAGRPTRVANPSAQPSSISAAQRRTATKAQPSLAVQQPQLQNRSNSSLDAQNMPVY